MSQTRELWTGCRRARAGNVVYRTIHRRLELASLSHVAEAGGFVEAIMPLLLVPVLWVGGTAILLGGGYYLISHVLVR